MQRVVNDHRLRAIVGRKRALTQEENVYGEKIPEGYFEKFQLEAILDEFHRQKIILLAENKPISVKELAQEIKIDSGKILEHVVTLRGKGSLALDHVDVLTPYYVTMMR